MPRICLSYRRADSSAIAGRIYDRLVARYGADTVFMDVSDIPYGVDFREHIQAAFRDTALLLAIIGTGWLGEGAARKRIHEKVDPVRVEIHTALRQQIPVIPVLIDSAKMPSADELPRDIKDFAFRNATRVDSGADFAFHIERLMRHIDQVLGIAPPPQPAASAVADRGPPVTAPNADTDAPATVLAALTLWGARLLPYFLAPVVLLWLAHYLIIMKLDADPVYLRIAAIVIPLPSGYLLFRKLQFGVGAAALLGFCAAVVAVVGMLAAVALVDGHAIVPASRAEWQEVFEYVVTMSLATVAGNLLARFAYATVPGRSGTA
ncbi:MAG TPA: toll/interleukin-1 receptor domain-containing protein [Xanthobacteraceae bacterium]|nr:toll/interleukin-1 receptor domain-containing protein [Xanthobacteraceae bacterium]